MAVRWDIKGGGGMTVKSNPFAGSGGGGGDERKKIDLWRINRRKNGKINGQTKNKIS